MQRVDFEAQGRRAKIEWSGSSRECIAAVATVVYVVALIADDKILSEVTT